MDAIVSVTREWAIGRDGGLLVRNRADMRRFVQLTRGCTVLMGRKTYESFPTGPLKGRRNVVVTRNASYDPPNVPEELPGGTSLEVTHSPDEALASTSGDSHVWLIGGESLYRALLSRCVRCFVTRNDVSAPDADAFFPNLDDDPAWEIESWDGSGTTDEGIPYSFVTYRSIALAGAKA